MLIILLKCKQKNKNREYYTFTIFVFGITLFWIIFSNACFVNKKMKILFKNFLQILRRLNYKPSKSWSDKPSKKFLF